MPLAGLRQSQRRGKKEKVGGGGTVRKMRGRRVLTKGKKVNGEMFMVRMVESRGPGRPWTWGGSFWFSCSGRNDRS